MLDLFHMNAINQIKQNQAVQTAEIAVQDETCFVFHAYPYYLRLNLPHAVINTEDNDNEDELPTSKVPETPFPNDGGCEETTSRTTTKDVRKSRLKYDSSEGKLWISLPKLTPGLHFPDLDLLSKLLAPRGDTGKTLTSGGVSGPPSIQVLSSQISGGEQDPVINDPIISMDQIGGSNEEAEEHWDFPQEAPSPSAGQGSGYGFNQMYSGFSSHISALLSILDPYVADTLDSTADLITLDPKEGQRDKELVHNTYLNSVFSSEWIMADHADNPLLHGEIIPFKMPWAKQLRQQQVKPSANAAQSWTRDQQDMLLQLPNRKEYLITPAQERTLYLSLLDILFAYAYEARSTLCEGTVESGWSIARCSRVLATLDTSSPTSLSHVVRTSTARALCFPLYRNAALAWTVWQDVMMLVKLGKRSILTALLHLRSLFHGGGSEGWTDLTRSTAPPDDTPANVEADLSSTENGLYLLNRLVLDDFCVWVQTGASDGKLRNLASQLHHMLPPNKATDLLWDIQALEDATLADASIHDDDSNAGEEDENVQETEIVQESKPQLPISSGHHRPLIMELEQ